MTTLRREQIEAQIEDHLNALNTLDRDAAYTFTDNYRKYFVSFHMNEVERLETELEHLYDN